MNEILILVGVMMIVSDIIVYILGYKRGVPNTILWSIFPILHGFHEFTEFFIDNFNLISYTERFEIFFSISGSFILLAASLEYNGVLQRPIGKLSALVGLVTTSYFIFGLPDEIIEDLENTVLVVGILQTDLIRFLQGFFLTILAIIAILSTSLYLLRQSKRGITHPDHRLKQTTVVSILLLGLYSLFEGFTWEAGIFITLRAISLGLFIIVPMFFILINKIGLQSLIIIDKGGIPLMVYNFTSDDFISFNTTEGQRILLASGFLAALTSFSGDILKAGSSMSIRTNKLFFIISKYKSKIYALQTININKNVQKSFDQLTKEASLKLEHIPDPNKADHAEIKPIITSLFSLYY